MSEFAAMPRLTMNEAFRRAVATIEAHRVGVAKHRRYVDDLVAKQKAALAAAEEAKP